MHGCTVVNSFYADAWGEAFEEELPGQVFQVTVRGSMKMAMGDAVAAKLAERFKQPIRAVSLSWLEMRTYESEARATLIAFARTNRLTCAAYHVLTRSAVVLMGVNTAKVPLAMVGVDLTATGDEKIFNARLAEIISRAA